MFINVKTVIMFLLLSEQARMRPTWFVRANWCPHVGDPCYTITTHASYNLQSHKNHIHYLTNCHEEKSRVYCTLYPKS